MHFFNLIKNINKKLIIFVDMDGVIASFDIGKPYDFENKRPLINNINTIKQLLTLNVELHILSICRLDNQIIEKNNWLDKYASFFDKNNRHIISKESNPNYTSKELKNNFLNNFNTNEQTVLIDDDNEVLFYIKNNNKNIILFQDSELID